MKKDYWPLLWELTKTDLKLRYAGSILGFVWVFLKPFITFAILLLVFSTIFGQHDHFYTLNLLIGLVIFNYFSEGTAQLTDVLLKRANIILKLNFPRMIIVWSSLLSSLINFLASLVFFLILVGVFFRSSYVLNVRGILLFVATVVLLSSLILGFGFFASVIQVKFRDFQQIWILILQLLLYSTPIIYPVTILPSYLQEIILVNPLTIIVDLARAGLLGSPLIVSIQSVVILFVGIIAINITGYYFFKRQIKRVTEEI